MDVIYVDGGGTGRTPKWIRTIIFGNELFRVLEWKWEVELNVPTIVV